MYRCLHSMAIIQFGYRNWYHMRRHVHECLSRVCHIGADNISFYIFIIFVHVLFSCGHNKSECMCFIDNCLLHKRNRTSCRFNNTQFACTQSDWQVRYICVSNRFCQSRAVSCLLYSTNFLKSCFHNASECRHMEFYFTNFNFAKHSPIYMNAIYCWLCFLYNSK